MKQDILDLAKVDSKKIMPFIDKIKFYGFVPWGEELKSILLQSDCLLMCSISEGTPRVLMEARAFGCPVIATDVGGVSTSITNMKDGYLVEQGNSHEMVKLVEYLINNPLIREKVVNEGLITSRKYSIESMAKTFISAIATLNGV